MLPGNLRRGKLTEPKHWIQGTPHPHCLSKPCIVKSAKSIKVVNQSHTEHLYSSKDTIFPPGIKLQFEQDYCLLTNLQAKVQAVPKIRVFTIVIFLASGGLYHCSLTSTRSSWKGGGGLWQVICTQEGSKPMSNQPWQKSLWPYQHYLATPMDLPLILLFQHIKGHQDQAQNTVLPRTA